MLHANRSEDMERDSVLKIFCAEIHHRVENRFGHERQGNEKLKGQCSQVSPDIKLNH